MLDDRCDDRIDRDCRGLVHSITSSARPSIVSGIVRPSACAVFRLTTSSNFVGCWIGRSAGLAPFRILSTWSAEIRTLSVILGPYDIRAPAAAPPRPPAIYGRRWRSAASAAPGRLNGEDVIISE